MKSKQRKLYRKISLVISLITLFVFCLFIIFYPTPPAIFKIPLEKKPSSTKELNFSLPSPAPYPLPKLPQALPPELTAKAAIVIDTNSDTVLYSRNKFAPLKMASITKLLTALTALDIYEPRAILEVKRKFEDGVIIGLEPKEKMSLENLIQAMLVASANDAAQVLADNSSHFIDKMNQKAREINLKNSRFSNPQGFDEGENYTTVTDLAFLGSVALKNPFIKKTVSTKKTTIKNVAGKTYELININELLFSNPEFLGIKTGNTEEAGECLLSYVEENGRKLIIAIVGSEDRFGETLLLKNWAMQNFVWKTLN